MHTDTEPWMLRNTTGHFIYVANIVLRTSFIVKFIMAFLWNRAGHYIFALWFLLPSIFFSSLNLSRRRLDVCHTCTHGVVLVRI